jgi:hypothetical protein
VIALVTALVTPILAAFLPRLWQDDLQRLRSVSEARVKRLEALEKALSVNTTAKADGIDVTIHDLQRELEQIVHEFAGPAVLSREELEKWDKLPFLKRLSTRPHFTVPAKNAKYYKFIIIMSYISVAIFVVYFPLLSIIQIIFPEFFPKWIDKLAQLYSTSKDIVLLFLGVIIPSYFIVLPFIGVYGRYRTAKEALRTLRDTRA